MIIELETTIPTNRIEEAAAALSSSDCTHSVCRVVYKSVVVTNNSAPHRKNCVSVIVATTQIEGEMLDQMKTFATLCASGANVENEVGREVFKIIDNDTAYTYMGRYSITKVNILT